MNKADDNSDTADSLSFLPQYLNINHVTYYVITARRTMVRNYVRRDVSE